MGENDIATALERVRSVLVRKPEAGVHDDAPATARWAGGVRVVASHANGMQFQSDLPTELGGTGDQVSPGWFFRAGLASCATTSIAMAAAQRGVALTRLEVRADSRSDTRGMLGMAGDDGQPAYAGPGELRLQVRIAADGMADDALRQLVHDSLGHSPIPCAARQATPLAIDVQPG